MSQNDTNHITFDILLTDYKHIKEENKLLRDEKDNLRDAIKHFRYSLHTTRRIARGSICILLVLLVAFFYQCYLYSSLKEENIKLKSQISSERSYK